MPKKWKILPKSSDDIVEQLLINRGIKLQKDQDSFFNPDLKDYKSDLNIPNIKSAFKRIEQAIKDEEQITVYGDYDVDGICASTIIYKALSSLGAKIIPYIPHREKEGYGMSKIGLEAIRDSGTKLVITVDNGVVAFDQALYAKELNMDLIITDHHLPIEEGKFPEALSIVHSTMMCGAAVAWCLVRDSIDLNLSKELLQFAAIATVADMMPLLGVNRAILSEGLKVLNKTDNPGLKALILEAVINEPIGSYEIGHMIAPRLNAIGRLEHAIDAVRLLCTTDLKRARTLAKQLTEVNSKRQLLTQNAVDGARLKIDSTKKIHIVYSSEWIPGVIGLVAARVCQENFRPAIAISVGGEVSKGSARSIDGINIVELIRKCSDLLIDIGGHSGAAGFSINNDKIEEFKKRLEDLMESEVIDEVQVIEIEAVVDKKEINKSLFLKLAKLEPFGLANPKPILAVKGVIISDIRTLSEGKHLKFRADGIDVIAFGLGSMSSLLKNGELVDIAFGLEINKFNGSENLQLKAIDIKLSATNFD